jgi:amidohydrolase
MPLSSLIAVRRRLHGCAEVSGAEERTAAVLERELRLLAPDGLLVGLGGHGLAAVFEGQGEGPGVLLRADMDALPLAEIPGLAWGSNDPGVSHKCGHDGHMSLLLGVARLLAKGRPQRGRAVLVFQPAEETGAGARGVLEDARFAGLGVERVLAVHNLPGYPLGALVSRPGCFASASRGLRVQLRGVSCHAAEPQCGRSPLACAAQLALALAALPQQVSALHEAAQVTVVGLEAGGSAFGTSPGSASVCATLRSHRPEVLERLVSHGTDLARGLASAWGLECGLEWLEDFPATWNDAAVVAVVESWARQAGMSVVAPKQPFAWSEDFGHFTASHPGALFGLGAGEDQPALHHPDYDFPDALLEPGVRFLHGALSRLLQEDSP